MKRINLTVSCNQEEKSQSQQTSVQHTCANTFIIHLFSLFLSHIHHNTVTSLTWDTIIRKWGLWHMKHHRWSKGVLTKTSQLCATGGQQAVLGDELQSTMAGGLHPARLQVHFGERRCLAWIVSQHTLNYILKTQYLNQGHVFYHGISWMQLIPTDGNYWHFICVFKAWNKYN